MVGLHPRLRGRADRVGVCDGVYNYRGGDSDVKQTDSQKILALDGYQCQHPGCGKKAIHVHHIRFRSEKTEDYRIKIQNESPENLISFCTEHHSIIETGRKVDGVWQSGRQYMIWVLNQHSMRFPFRWRAVRRWLINCESRHRVGEKV